MKIILLIAFCLFFLALAGLWVQPNSPEDAASIQHSDLQDKIRGQKTGFMLPHNTGDNLFVQVIAFGRHQGPD